MKSAMITIWRADFEGNAKQLERFDAKLREIVKRHGGQVDGPYMPQNSSLLYLFHHATDKVVAGGPELLAFVQKEKIPLAPVSYEIAHTPDEFWGRGKLWA